MWVGEFGWGSLRPFVCCFGMCGYSEESGVVLGRGDRGERFV